MWAPRARPWKNHFAHIRNSYDLSFEIPEHPHSEIRIQEVGFCLWGGAGEWREGALPSQNPPTFVQFSAFWIIAHICSLRTYSCLAAKTASACEDISSWSELQASTFAGEAEHMQSPDLQDHWDICSQLLWGTLEVAAGPQRCRVDKWSGGRINLFICGEGRSCRSKKYHPWVGCMYMAGGLRVCTSGINSSSLLSCILEF